MQWNEETDVFLRREMASLGVFQDKSRSRERGQIWHQIATNLNGYPSFSVTLRAVRQRFTTITKKYKAQDNGLSVQELTEYETLLKDLIERYEESGLKSEQEVADKKSIEKDKQTALDIRKTAMEQYGETKKRREMKGDDQPKEKKSRRTSSDMLTFLQEKLEFDKERLRQEQERRERESQDNALNQQQMLDRQMQTFQLMAQQQQQQFMAMMEFMNKKNN